MLKNCFCMKTTYTQMLIYRPIQRRGKEKSQRGIEKVKVVQRKDEGKEGGEEDGGGES